MVFTTDGKNEVRNWLVGDSATAPLAIAIGSGSTSATVGDTALVSELIRKTFSSTTTSPQTAIFESLLLSTEITTSTVREMGLFNTTASTSGTMFTRNTFAEIQKTDSIEIQFENRLEFA